MTDHEALFQVLRPLRPRLEELAQVAHATANPRDSLRLAKQLIGGALDADFAAIARAAKRSDPRVPAGVDR